MTDPIKPPPSIKQTQMQPREGRNIPYDQRSEYDVAYAKHRKRELDRIRKLRQRSREQGDKALFDILTVMSAALDGRALYVGPDGNWHEKPIAEVWEQPEPADKMTSKEQRDELNRRMISDFRKSWAVHGADAVETIAREKPADYLKLIASVMPKEVEQTLEHRFVVEIPTQADSALSWQEQYGIKQQPVLELIADETEKGDDEG